MRKGAKGRSLMASLFARFSVFQSAMQQLKHEEITNANPFSFLPEELTAHVNKSLIATFMFVILIELVLLDFQLSYPQRIFSRDASMLSI